MPFSVLIDGVDRTALTRAVGAFRVEYQLGALTRCDLEVRDLDSFATAYRPVIDQLLAIAAPNIGQRHVFNGMIFGIGDVPLGAPGVGTVTRISAVSNWRAASKRRVSAQFRAGYSLKKHVNYLTVTYLQDFNIYINPAMLEGPELGAITWDQVTVEEAMNRLSDLTGWVYRLRPATPNDVVEMFPIGDEARAIQLSAANANIFGSVTWSRSREIYLNRVIVRYGTDLTPVTDDFVGDGSTLAFPLGYPLTGPPGPEVIYWSGGGVVKVTDEFHGDGNAAAFPLSKPLIAPVGPYVRYFGGGYPEEGGLEPCGLPGENQPWYIDGNNNLIRDPAIAGVSNPPGIGVRFTYEYNVEGLKEGCGIPGAGYPWYIDGNNNLVRDPAIPGVSNPPAAGVAISYTYNVQFPLTVIAEDAAEIAARGVWEDIFEAPATFKTADAQTYADSLLQKYQPTPRTVTLRTRTAVDWLPGDTVVVDVPERALPVGAYFVTGTIIAADVDQELTTTLTLMEGNVPQESWLDFWRKTIGGARTSGTVLVGQGEVEGGGGGGGGGDLTGTGTAGQLAAWDGQKSLANSGLTVAAGKLTGGATGAGFTVDVGASTVVGVLPLANLPPYIAFTNVANVFAGPGPQTFQAPAGSGTEAIRVRARPDGDLRGTINFTTDAGVGLATISVTAPSGSMSIQPNADLLLAPVGTGKITLSPASTPKEVGPIFGYAVNLGALQRKFLALYVAELWAETLVAQQTMATIGGRILVGPTTTLARDCAPADTNITVKHNFFKLHVAGVEYGSKVVLESAGKFEAMAVTDETAPPPNGDGTYTYAVLRNYDGGAGADQWYAGDAVFDTGKVGDGFIDLYALQGVGSATVSGPTIVGNVRPAVSGWPGFTPRWAIGNLNGLYWYSSNVYGVAFGAWDTTNVTIDATYGLRIRYQDQDRLVADTSGNLSLVGNLTVGAAGIIRSAAATGLDTGVGFYLAGGSVPVFRVGVPGGNQVRWDGTNLNLRSANVQINEGGIRVGPLSPTVSTFNAYDFTSNDAGQIGVFAAENAGADRAVYLTNDAATNLDARTWLRASNPTNATSLQLIAYYAGHPSGVATEAILSAQYFHVFAEVRVNSPGTIKFPQHGGNIYIQADSAQSITLHADPNAQFYFRTYAFHPFPNLTIPCGHPSYRWHTVYCGALDQSSDARAKRDLAPCDLGLAFLRQLPVYSFRFLDDDTPGRIGFTTQDIDAALDGRPWAAVHHHADAYSGLDYAAFVPVLTNALKELDVRLRHLEGRA